MLSGDFIPARTMTEFLFINLLIIKSRLLLVSDGSSPLSISFAPRHRITMLGLSPSDHSILDSPFFEVFPEMLAFINLIVGSFSLKLLVNSEDKFSF